MPAAGSAQVTTLFSNAVLSRLERLRINTQRRFTDRRRGEHIAGRSGTSNEFSDYRDYVAGDDVRFVDWNIFARLHRPYLKLYHQEEEMHVAVLVDASASMQFDGKLERARQLAAAFAVMGLFGTEKVSVHAFNALGASLSSIGPCRGRANLSTVLSFVEGIAGGGDEPVDQAVEEFLKRHSGRGVAIILSDFFTFGELHRTFNRLFSAGQEIHAVQILAPAELDPELTGDTRLVDSETSATLDVSFNADLLALYHEYLESLSRDLWALCRRRAGRFLSASSAEPLNDILFDRMRRGGWLR
jgi:uncharacterized protein (DUF58 family)